MPSFSKRIFWTRSGSKWTASFGKEGCRPVPMELDSDRLERGSASERRDDEGMPRTLDG
jgi:hypothetical protein